LDFLEELFGHDVWSEFIEQNPEDLLDIKRKFEAKKTGLTVMSVWSNRSLSLATVIV
jgi:hypothetical protein